MSMRWSAVVFCGMLAGVSAFAENWISRPEYGSVSVVAKAPHEADAKAISEFVTYWERATGHRPEVTDRPGTAVNVWIGTSALSEEWKAALDLDTLGLDGLVLKTFPTDAAKHLVLAGAPGKGVVYAVYEFLERALGIRWFVPGVERVPTAPERISTFDYRYTPPLAHRATHLADGSDPDHYRIHSPFTYGMRGHSFYQLLPPEKHFAEHPEWYSEIGGKRVAAIGFDWDDVETAIAHSREVGQLCMTNPEVAEALARELDARIAAKPEANLWSVAQMDWSNNCTCAACREIDEREGSPAASLLVGVNRVAELVEQKHPGTYIQTYAYTYTRKPPKTVRPRHNVIIQLCSIECDFAHAFDDPEATANRSFREDMKGWNALGAKLLLYNYPINCRYPCRPYPYEYVLARNARFAADSGAIGVFEQAHIGEATALGYLRQYMIAKLLWNPDSDVDALAREFIDTYYGNAAPHLWDYFRLGHDTLRSKGVQMFLFDDCGWIDRAFVDRAEGIFKQAFAAADSEEIRKRVDIDYFGVQCAAQLCRPEYSFEKDRIVVHRPPMLTRGEILRRAEELGVKKAFPAWWVPGFDHMLAGFPETRPEGPVTSPLVALENERYLLWAAPEFKGSILRMRDKKLGVELLKGYETYDTAPGTYQEWSAIGEMGEGFAAARYEVESRGPHESVLTATTKNRLMLTRTMRLAPGSDRIEIRLEVANAADTPQPISVKIHPEFYCQEPAVLPELWLRTAEGWQRAPGEDAGGNTNGAQLLPPSAPGEWAAYVPKADISLVSGYAPHQIDKLLLYYNTGKGAEQINLELLPARRVLQPGERHSLDTWYSVVQGRPGERK